MDRYAVGFLEVQGYSVALAAADKACKAANITVHGMDCNNPPDESNAVIPVMVQVKFTGPISDVRIALEVAYETACEHVTPNEVMIRCIPSSSSELHALLPIGKVKRK
ncbi:BMC domain-containing protein [Paenibacillus motobuensis]|uniref:Bacterial microcompartment domain-containing protein n=1 Tax=Paenibacillus motobuensis TaxID=295324 RepID=A0ABP3IKS3_9BACL